MKLRWQVAPAPLPNMQLWGAVDGLATYVISRDVGCRSDDRHFGRFAVSAKLGGGQRHDLGLHDTLAEAQAAAEASRHRASK